MSIVAKETHAESLRFAKTTMPSSALPRTKCFIEDDTEVDAINDACRIYPKVISARDASREYPPDLVLVNLYEISGFDSINWLTASERLPIGGALHAGVQVYDREWSYGGGSGSKTGILCGLPRKNRQHRFRETISLSRTVLTDKEVAQVIGELIELWPAHEYHWLHRNCLSFANEFCERLGVDQLPAWIDRFARGASAVENGVRVVADGMHGVLRALVGGSPRSSGSSSGSRPNTPTFGRATNLGMSLRNGPSGFNSHSTVGPSCFNSHSTVCADCHRTGRDYQSNLHGVGIGHDGKTAMYEGHTRAKSREPPVLSWASNEPFCTLPRSSGPVGARTQPARLWATHVTSADVLPLSLSLS